MRISFKTTKVVRPITSKPKHRSPNKTDFATGETNGTVERTDDVVERTDDVARS